MWSFRNARFSFTAAILASTPAPLQHAETSAADVVPREWLVISPLDVAGRRPFRCDAVFAKHLLDRKSAPPSAGEKLAGELGKEATWVKKETEASGSVDGDFAWAYAAVESPAARVALAELEGAFVLYVNGTPFAGDAYKYGFRGVPVALRAGRNDVFVGGIRGGFTLKLREPPGPLVLADWDATFPDAKSGPAAVLVLNASEKPFELEKPFKRRFLPLEAAKVPIAFDTGSAEIGKHAVAVKAEGPGASASASFEVENRRPSEAARHVFRSRIDGSVQPYAVLPAMPGGETEEGMGLVLTLHGAGVDALGQARSYSAKPDFWIVAPTNRRPYGFDWQDWGRTDAYEVLKIALAETKADPNHVCLTGHSMGGHGAWHLAVNDPDTFAAVAPSAGWISFDTYGGGRPKGALADLWQRADGASRTFDLISNLAGMPVYILHGSADDNVPVTEAREAKKTLEDKGNEVTLHVQEGAGHWWDGSASPGVDCVDWPPIFEMFRKSSRAPGSSAPLDWISVDPSVDSKDRWVEVAQPLEYGRSFRVRGAEGSLATENVRRLRIALDRKRSKAELRIDEAPVPRSSSGWYLRGAKGWSPDESGPPESEKSPTKSGPFKLAFDRDFAIVYGTGGNEEEDRELQDLARWLSESWWYRGNGSATVVSDRELQEHRGEYAKRNVIVLGNADTNSAWKLVVPPACPVQARRGSLALGEKKHEGAGLAALFVFPRADGPALVGALADTGAAGTRLLQTVPVFVSGVGIPDFALLGPEILTKGDGGVIAAGWFGPSWQL